MYRRVALKTEPDTTEIGAQFAIGKKSRLSQNLQAGSGVDIRKNRNVKNAVLRQSTKSN